uniref:G-protein coupled receptors family 1 profile domain-containing protein n=1 Tax=Bos indicus x Bos taurus TaxID=30522 RepID=A0A4W2CHF8_BOBOX
MWSSNRAAPFLLTGFLGLKAVHRWIPLPFFIIYLSILSGNGTLLPMYYFQAMLAGTHLGMMLTTMPIVLGVLLLDRREIAQSSCFTQSYFIHTLAIVESGILPARAYDRFIDIRSPLRYSSIITISWVMKIGLWALVSDFVFIVPPILPLYLFPYRHPHVPSHAFCLHQDGMKLTCADITFNHVYPVILVASTFFLDTVMSIASGEERAKALNTCVSHISCVLVSYITVIGLTFHPQVWDTKQIQRSIVCLFSVSNRLALALFQDLEISRILWPFSLLEEKLGFMLTRSFPR